MPHTVTMFYAALLGLLLIVLSWGVSKNRMRAQVSLGHGGDESLSAAIRAQGNFIEYVPLALILLLLAESSGAQTWLLHVFGGALLLGRLMHAQGILHPKNVNNFRKIGISLTWLMILVTSIYNLGYLVGVAF